MDKDIEETSLVPLQVELTTEYKSALKAGVAVSEDYRTMRNWVESKIEEDFGSFLAEGDN